MFALSLLMVAAYNALLLQAAHHQGGEKTVVGLPHIDVLVYYACAREPWDEHRWLRYASPYSSLADSPAVYSHLVFLLIGAVWKVAGSVFATDQLLRAVCGTLTLFLGALVVRRATPAHLRDMPISLACMALVIAGGGLAWCAATFNVLLDATYSTFVDHQYLPLLDWIGNWPGEWELAEGCYGEWGASLPRVIFSVPECVYHVLFFGSLLLLLSGQWQMCVVLAALTWWSHPYTGFLLGTILIIYYLVRCIRREPRSRAPLLIVLLVQMCFLAYYMLYLPRFPEHRAVLKQMSEFGATMLVSKMLPAYGLLIVFTLIYLLSAQGRGYGDSGQLLMVCWLICDLLLIFSDHFVSLSIQPMHFSRGYLYVPLAYFTLRALQQFRWSSLTKRRQLVCAAGLLALQLPDTFGYYMRLPTQFNHLGTEMAVSKDVADCLKDLDDALPEPTTIHIMPSAFLPGAEQLLALWSHHRPYLGHSFNTPFIQQKSIYASQLALEPVANLPGRFGLQALVVGKSDLSRLAGVDLPGSSPIHLKGERYVVRIPHSNELPPI